VNDPVLACERVPSATTIAACTIPPADPKITASRHIGSVSAVLSSNAAASERANSTPKRKSPANSSTDRRATEDDCQRLANGPFEKMRPAEHNAHQNPDRESP
jgi:hypothetical protein